MKLKLGKLKSILDWSTPQEQVAVTILFADICGSTRLFEQYGDMRARLIETRVLDTLTDETGAYGGAVIKTIGDELMCRFPDAEQAVRAACDMHRAIKSDPELVRLNLAIKIGLHHGPVLVEKNDVFGDAVNVAARMVSCPRPIRSSPPVKRLVCCLKNSGKRPAAWVSRRCGASRTRWKSPR